jgi:hypothetical protein
VTHDPDPRPEDRDLPEVPRKAPDEPPGILGQPERIARWMKVLFGVSLVLLLVDFVYVPHFHTDLESGGGLPGFYGLYGFAGLVVLVLGAKILRQIVMRPEDYYDE